MNNQDCNCGSGKCKFPLKDGYGIFLTYACDDCEDEKLSGFRSDIQNRYDTDEVIEPGDYLNGSDLVTLRLHYGHRFIVQQ